LVTLSATVDPSAITSRVTPKGSLVSSHPGAPAVASTAETKSPLLKLSDLKNVKLRTWTLTDEIGE
jgi:hypothetical protein